jgi:SRSO17 transposase
MDDTGIHKQGNVFVGVATQYSGTFGKVGNLQVVVNLQYADPRDTWPMNARLYVAREWADDPERCYRTHVPDNLVFRPKTDIAIELLDQADALDVSVVFDSGYGGYLPFRETPEIRHKHYVGEVLCDDRVRLPREVEAVAKSSPLPTELKDTPRKKPYPWSHHNVR